MHIKKIINKFNFFLFILNRFIIRFLVYVIVSDGNYLISDGEEHGSAAFSPVRGANPTTLISADRLHRIREIIVFNKLSTFFRASVFG